MDFKNTLIIMTSNVGSSVIEKGGGGLGFQLDTSEEDSSYNRIKTLVNEELKQYFRPEFLNRWVSAASMFAPHFAALISQITCMAIVHDKLLVLLECCLASTRLQASLTLSEPEALSLSTKFNGLLLMLWEAHVLVACRLDEIIVFRQLTKGEVKQIADIMLGEVFKRAEEKEIKIDVTERFKVSSWLPVLQSTS